jgi:hypothetical protein
VPSRVRFVIDYLEELLKENYTQRRLKQRSYFQLRKHVLGDRQLMLEMSRALFEDPGKDIDLPGFGPLRLVELQSLTSKNFPFIVVPPAKERRSLSCFVGCRFTAGLPQLLEFNLRTVLDAWRVDVRTADADLSSSSLLERITQDIRTADFCVFDNRGTLETPNVYIEVGIAWVAKKPMIFCEYQGRHRIGLKTVPPTGSLPVDLRQLTRVQFKNDEELFRRIYFGFPRFVKKNGLQ